MLLDLPSRQEVLDLAAKLDTVLALLERPVPKPDDLMSVEEVADYTRFHRRTVEKWAEVGEYNHQGKRVFLPAYRYTGRLRFKRGDVEAFGLGIGALQPSIAGEPPQPVKSGKPAKKPKAPLASTQALRVA
jgi:excisionase family DNA binding protein